MKNRELIYNITFYIYIIISIFVWALLSNNIDPDFWARIIQGDAFWQLGHILKSDIFSYTQTHTWFDHEWGVSVLFSFVLRHFGYWGIFTLRILLAFLIIYMLFKTAEYKSEKKLKILDFCLFNLALVVMPSIFSSALRCHYITFLFFILFIYLFERVRKNGENKLLFLLPLIMLVWVNCHGGCVSGLGLLCIYTIGEALNKKSFKKYILTLFACLAVMFINPYGIDYVKFIFMASTMPRPFVTEWISPFASSNPIFFWFKLYYIFFLFILIIKVKDYKNDITKYILLFVCAYLSFVYIKNIPFFVITSIIFLYSDICKRIYNIIDNNKERLKKENNNDLLLTYEKRLNFIHNILPYVCMVLFTGFNAFCIIQPDLCYLREQPVSQAEFFKINNLNGKILAPMELGSYLAYKLFPNNLIYMDGRYEEVYFNKEKELLDKFYNAQEGWEEILKEPYKPDYIIIPIDALINDYIPVDYKSVYSDEKYIIYSSKEKLKDMYYMPVPSSLCRGYTKQAFKKGFEFNKIDKKSL